AGSAGAAEVASPKNARVRPAAIPVRARWGRPWDTTVLLRGCTCAFCHVRCGYVARAGGLTGVIWLSRLMPVNRKVRTAARPPAARAHQAAGQAAAPRLRR